jgi:glycosyltransferase involved in cell wall biosynthesis
MDLQVSVCIFSYNYEKYIAQTIESVLDQETNFPVEIIVGDDVSTDNTREIVTRYQQRYPEKIRLSFNQKNLGGTSNWIQTMNQARGKYIALIDGDDYFIDRYKLQKQYDVLEKSPDANLCFHSVREIFENDKNREEDIIFPLNEYRTSDLLRKGWFVRTSSLFFRNRILPANPPQWVYDFPYRYDSIMITWLSLGSRVINCKDVMTVWRRHDAGVSYNITRDYHKNYVEERNLYGHLNQLTSGKYLDDINLYIRKQRTSLVSHSLKRFSWKSLRYLGWEAFNIDYAFLFRLFAASIRSKFGKSTSWVNE